MKLIQLMNGLLDRLFVVAGAFIGSQIPSFMHQYTQRLAGHVEELNHLLEDLRKVASYSHKTLDQYIEKFMSSTDLDFSRQGEFMQNIVVRWEDLSQSLNHLLQSTIWNRPYVFLSHVNYDIAKETFYSFQPGLALTGEGMYYTGIGLAMGYIFYQILAKLLRVTNKRIMAVFRQKECT
jgi:hypothetical protein